MNKERLLAVADGIIADPKSYNQEYFFDGIGVGTTCGSTQCICGRGIVMYQPEGKALEQQWIAFPQLRNYSDIWERGKEVFDLDGGQAERLFSEVPEYFDENPEDEWSKEGYDEDNSYFGDEIIVWPYEFAKRYHQAKSGEERAQIAYERIHHFINTDGAE